MAQVSFTTPDDKSAQIQASKLQPGMKMLGLGPVVSVHTPELHVDQVVVVWRDGAGGSYQSVIWRGSAAVAVAVPSEPIVSIELSVAEARTLAAWSPPDLALARAIFKALAKHPG